mmetsp:Transcript_92284/g.264486  ORF Transcript_92284/g.264486 Transcript_92284/m.264486 type:complete len:259 (-) Transcript_92284:453-1229(-)
MAGVAWRQCSAICSKLSTKLSVNSCSCSRPMKKASMARCEAHWSDRLLNIDAARKQIRGDEHPRGARAKLPHHQLALFLVEARMHHRDREVPLLQLVRERVNLALRVAIDDALRDGQGLVEVHEHLEFPLLSLQRNVELVDALQSQLCLFHQDAHGVPHEVLRQGQYFWRQGRREEADLHLWVKHLEDLVDLVLEAVRQHLVRLVQDETLEPADTQRTRLDHVVDATWCAAHDMLPRAEIYHVVTTGGAADASVALQA